jgi:hypothetical protein
MSGLPDDIKDLVRPIDKCGDCVHYKSFGIGEHGADLGGRCNVLLINRFKCWDTCVYFVKFTSVVGSDADGRARQ